MSYTMGADPEMFIFAGRKLLPAYEFLPSKMASESTIYWDGFQAEWKYSGGEFCLNLFVHDTQHQLKRLLRYARKYNEKATLSLQNVVAIPQALLKSAPEQYVALGCEPSFNAYGSKPDSMDNPRKLKIRVAGGHMHFGGWSRAMGSASFVHTIKVLDSIVGIWAVGAAQNIDVPLRRKYYGLAGEYRLPKYQYSRGLEYRTLSNFWLCHPRIMQITFEIARCAINLARCKNLSWVSTKEEVIRTINECDVDHAKKILKRNKAVFNAMLAGRNFNKESQGAALNVGLNGVETEVDTNSVEKNWQLDRRWEYKDIPTWRKASL